MSWQCETWHRTKIIPPLAHIDDDLPRTQERHFLRLYYRSPDAGLSIAEMSAPVNLPAIFNPTSQDIENLLAAQCHIGSKNLQVHMDPYLWKTRPDGINIINLSKTW